MTEPVKAPRPWTSQPHEKDKAHGREFHLVHDANGKYVATVISSEVDAYVAWANGAASPSETQNTTNAEPQSGAAEAESQAPSIRDGDAGVAPGQSPALPHPPASVPQLQAQIEAARQVILRGVELLDDRVGEWEGARAWLEQDAADYFARVTKDQQDQIIDLQRKCRREWDLRIVAERTVASEREFLGSQIRALKGELNDLAASASATGDNLTYMRFWEKHAQGSQRAPSCLVCGKAQPDQETWAVRHMELPNIIVCSSCCARPEVASATEPTGYRYRVFNSNYDRFGEWNHVAYKPQEPNAQFEVEPLYAAPACPSP